MFALFRDRGSDLLNFTYSSKCVNDLDMFTSSVHVSVCGKHAPRRNRKGIGVKISKNIYNSCTQVPKKKKEKKTRPNQSNETLLQCIIILVHFSCRKEKKIEFCLYYLERIAGAMTGQKRKYLTLFHR